MAMKMVRSSIQKEAYFDLFDVNPIDDVGSSFIPAMFICGTKDTFVAPHHSRELYEKYGGDR